MTLEQRIEAYCREKHIWGVLRVTRRGEILHEQRVGFADREKGIPFDGNSMFTFYSLSKPFCAIGLLRLYDRGLVDIDCHPSRYLPEAAGFDSRVTLRHMLHHVSGLPDFYLCEDFCEPYAWESPKAMREQVERLAAYPSRFAPNTDSQYANINFYLCALIIENVTGRPYEAYMREEVFAPLGMKHAVIERRPTDIPNRAQGYALVEGTPTAVSKSFDWMLGAGDIVATVEDVYCLNRAIKHRLLLREETWAQVLTPSPLNRMGLGCTLREWHGKTRITHNGGHTGFRTYHIQIPEDDFDVILLSNSGYGNARDDISEMIHRAFYGEDGARAPKPEMDKGYIK